MIDSFGTNLMKTEFYHFSNYAFEVETLHIRFYIFAATILMMHFFEIL